MRLLNAERERRLVVGGWPRRGLALRLLAEEIPTAAGPPPHAGADAEAGVETLYDGQSDRVECKITNVC